MRSSWNRVGSVASALAFVVACASGEDVSSSGVGNGDAGPRVQNTGGLGNGLGSAGGAGAAAGTGATAGRTNGGGGATANSGGATANSGGATADSGGATANSGGATADSGGSDNSGGHISDPDAGSAGGDLGAGGAASNPDASVGTGGSGTTGDGGATNGTGGTPANGGSPTGSGGTTASGGATNGAGGSIVGLDAGHDAYCAGQGPPVVVGDGKTTVEECAGSIAERSFANAVCTCQNVSGAGVLHTDSFSSNGSPTTVQAGAPVGVDNQFLMAGVPDIGGTFTVAGPNGLTLAGAMFAHGDLRVAGNLLIPGASFISRDLWVGGSVTAAFLTVDRDFHQPRPTFNPSIAFVSGKTINDVPFTIDPPCLCDDDDILDVDAIVAHGKTDNDNALIGLSPGALTGTLGPVSLTLPCGRYYLNTISNLGVVNVHVTGRTAIFVDGDVLTAGVLRFQVDPGAEVDIFLSGNFVPTGLVTLGDITRPAASRMYVGGSQAILLTGATFGAAGNIYAPKSLVTMTGFADLYGSVFARDIVFPGDMNVHYDRAILDSGKECPPPPPPGSGGASGSGGAPGNGGASGSGGAGSGGAGSGGAGSGGASQGSGGTLGSGGAGSGGKAASGGTGSGGKPSTPPDCKLCGTCGGGTACVDGSCGKCSSDGDCCSPLVCYPDGSCGPLLF